MNYRALSFSHKIAAVLGYVAIFYFSILFIRVEIAHHKEAMDMLSWEQSSGVITSSTTTYERRTFAKLGKNQWCTTLKYTYARHEIAHLSETTDCFNRKSDVEKFIEQYRTGKAIKIYVSPTNPHDSAITLEAPYDRKIRYLLCGAIIIMAFGAWNMILKKTAPEKPHNE